VIHDGKTGKNARHEKTKQKKRKEKKRKRKGNYYERIKARGLF
jgi:hypothetical protein